MGDRVALGRIEHRPPQAGHVIEERRPNNAAVLDIGHRRLVSVGEGRGVAVPGPSRGFVNIDEHRELGGRHALVTSRGMSAWHDGLQSLVAQEVGGQVVPFHVALLNPGDGQAEAAFGYPRRLRV
jgi:hypothetical protein